MIRPLQQREDALGNLICEVRRRTDCRRKRGIRLNKNLDGIGRLFETEILDMVRSQEAKRYIRRGRRGGNIRYSKKKEKGNSMEVKFVRLRDETWKNMSTLLV